MKTEYADSWKRVKECLEANGLAQDVATLERLFNELYEIIKDLREWKN